MTLFCSPKSLGLLTPTHPQFRKFSYFFFGCLPLNRHFHMVFGKGNVNGLCNVHNDQELGSGTFILLAAVFLFRALQACSYVLHICHILFCVLLTWQANGTNNSKPFLFPAKSLANMPATHVFSPAYSRLNNFMHLWSFCQTLLRLWSISATLTYPIYIIGLYLSI